MPAGADVELEAVPRADDVHVLLDEAETMAALALVQHLHHPVHHLSLADRPAHMRAVALPGVELVSQTRDADLQLALGPNLLAALGAVVCSRHRDLWHILSTPLFFRGVLWLTPYG